MENKDYNFSVDIMTEVDPVEKTITISDTVNKLHKQIFDTKERCVKQALVKLGWTPPAKPPNKLWVWIKSKFIF